MSPSTRNIQVDGYSISRRCNRPLTLISLLDVAVISLASTTFSSSFDLIALIALLT